ncbi:MAG: hypothetical protein M1837_000119 [Sclerophora amabilis]|nr:MAG: hypothetical protein M1837_000119 [Sclerophora amabilis]
MAKTARLAIVEAENIVPVGTIDPNHVDLPGIYIDRIVPATEEKHVEIRNLRKADSQGGEEPTKSEAMLRRERVSKRAAAELKHGYHVNLGVGMPTLAPSFLSPGTKVWIQSENGLLGMVSSSYNHVLIGAIIGAAISQGDYPTEEELDPDIINAGKETVTLIPGASTFDSSESFGMIRAGHVDISILGSLQVSANGDLANYMIPGKVVKGMGGAMDLISNPDETKIVVATDHVAKDGSSKIVDQCSLPLKGARVVSIIITDLVSLTASCYFRDVWLTCGIPFKLKCAFEVDRVNGELNLTELAAVVDVEEVRKKQPPNLPLQMMCGRWNEASEGYCPFGKIDKTRPSWS